MLASCVADAGGWPVVVGGRSERRELVPVFGAETGDGEGADVVIEAAEPTRRGETRSGLQARARHRALLFGGLPAGTEVAVDATRVHYEELTLRGAFHHTPSRVRAALAFPASGAHPWERLVSHRIALDQLPALFADPPDDLKAAVLP